MRKAQKGDTVRVHLTGCLDDGTRFASTFGEEPIELTIGEGKLIECFETSFIPIVAKVCNRQFNPIFTT